MKASSILAVVLATVALSVGGAFGASQFARTDAASAGGSSQIVSQLKKVNANLDDLNRAVGSSPYSNGTVRGLLKGICKQQGSFTCTP